METLENEQTKTEEIKQTCDGSKITFEMTEYMKLYKKTSKISELNEIYEDLCKILPFEEQENIKQNITEYEDDPITAVIRIWTLSLERVNLINWALMIDGNKTLGLSPESEICCETVLKENNTNYLTVLEQSIKFIRLINYFITEIAPNENTEEIKTYSRIPKVLLEDKEIGDVFQLPIYMSTVENRYLTSSHWFKSENEFMVHLKIPVGCENAGQIGDRSYYSYERETLISPYTFYTLVKKEKDDIWLDVCKDNKIKALDLI